MSDFIALGELLIDFTPSGELRGQHLFMQNAGGAPANVAAAVAGLGASASFIGMVGNDSFGRYLKGVLNEKDVNTSGLVLSDEFLTTLAFVHLERSGERDFSFYRKPGADMMLDTKHINEDMIKKSKVFHFGSISLTCEPVRSATLKALKTAKDNGVVISYDPNYRPTLWDNEAYAKEQMLLGLEYADILKISEDEAAFLFGEMEYEETAKILTGRGIKLVFITLGDKGVVYANALGAGKAEAYEADVVDTTGAGDCFTAGVLFKYLESGKKLSQISLEDVQGFADFACAAASICVEGRGGIPSMPRLGQVLERMRK